MAPTAASTSSTDKPAVSDEVSLGVVVGPHGLSGELRVRTASADALRPGLRVRLRRDDGGRTLERAIEAVRPGREGECRLRLEQVADRSGAESLRGTTLVARARDLPGLPAGEFYQHQLVGCRAFATDGRELGVVRSIWQTGAPDVLVIEPDSGGETLVPAAESVLREVDVDRRRVVLDLPPGLLDEA